MATRASRLAGFVCDRLPPPDLAVEVLLEDHVGTYLAPFACFYADGAWHNADTAISLEARVVGWRERQSGTRR